MPAKFTTILIHLTSFEINSVFENLSYIRDYKEVARLTVDQGEMQKKTLLKTKFSQFNDKRFYFSNGATSLPLFHPLLKDQAEYKKSKGQKIEKYFWYENEVLLEKENKAQEQNKRMLIYHQILMSAANYFPLNQKENFVENSF